MKLKNKLKISYFTLMILVLLDIITTYLAITRKVGEEANNLVLPLFNNFGLINALILIFLFQLFAFTLALWYSFRHKKLIVKQIIYVVFMCAALIRLIVVLNNTSILLLLR